MMFTFVSAEGADADQIERALNEAFAAVQSRREIPSAAPNSTSQKHLSEAEMGIIKEMASRGYTAAETSKHLGRTHSGVKKAAERAGVVFRKAWQKPNDTRG